MALNICGMETDEKGRELARHGTVLFPVACYDDDLIKDPVPWHWHTELEILVVLEGTAMVAAGTERFAVKQGEGFFINFGVLHAVWNEEGPKCRIHSAVFHPRLVGGGVETVFWQNYVGPLTGNAMLKCSHFDCGEPWHGEMIETIQAAWGACADEPPGYEFKVRDALSQIVFLLTSYRPATSKPPSKKALRDEGRIKTMMQYIQENYGSEIDTAAIAGSVSISESECLRCFRNMLGTPPMQYVREFRLQKSAELLISTEQGIAEIGAQCGFLDASYFTKTFREWKGLPPSDYRRSHPSSNSSLVMGNSGLFCKP